MVYPNDAKAERNVLYNAQRPPDPGEKTRMGVVLFSVKGKMAVPLYVTWVLIELNNPAGASIASSNHLDAFDGSHGVGASERLFWTGYQSWSISARSSGLGAHGSSRLWSIASMRLVPT